MASVQLFAKLLLAAGPTAAFDGLTLWWAVGVAQVGMGQDCK